MIVFASTISSSTMGLINPSVGIIISSSRALLTSIAVLITLSLNHIAIMSGLYFKIKYGIY